MKIQRNKEKVLKTKTMAQFQFETRYAGDALNIQADLRMREERGPISGVHVPPGGTYPFPSAPVNIIQADQQVYFEFSWRATGDIPTTLQPQGHWHLTLLFEAMGPAESPGNVTFETPVGPLDDFPHSEVITIPSEHFIPSGKHSEGDNVYKVVATMVWHNHNNRATPIAGFAEVCMLQVYDD